MTYKLERFGSVWLPVIEAGWDVGSGNSRINVQELPGGGLFDTLGGERAERAQTNIAHQAVLVGSSLDDLQDQLDDLKELRGVRDKLYRRMPDGSVQWCYARLDGLSASKDPRKKLSLAVNLSWVMVSRCWNGSHHGSGWEFNTGKYYDTGLVFDEQTGYSVELTESPQTIYINNVGNAIVKDLLIKLYNGSVSITNLEIFNARADNNEQANIIYNNTLINLDLLQINCGNWSVQNTPTPDFAHFAFGTYHAVDDIMPLYPGENEIVVTITGGLGGAQTPRIVFDFSDGWE